MASAQSLLLTHLCCQRIARVQRGANPPQCLLANGTTLVFPTFASTKLFFEWMIQYRLGRKRLRDTMLAASYFSAGVTRIVTLNPKDFDVFGCFEIIVPTPSSPPA